LSNFAADGGQKNSFQKDGNGFAAGLPAQLE
jgi:hypothetical protein